MVIYFSTLYSSNTYRYCLPPLAQLAMRRVVVADPVLLRQPHILDLVFWWHEVKRKMGTPTPYLNK